MNAGEGKSINKASKCKTATREGSKQGLKSVDFARLFCGLSHSKTVGRGFKSYCPCHTENPHESLILAGFCFFIFHDPRTTKDHFDAQIGHQFPICSVLFSTFPSGASSKEHQIVCAKNGYIDLLYILFRVSLLYYTCKEASK